MGYLLNLKSFTIHDESKSHVKRCTNAPLCRVETISEARAIASKNNEKLSPCKLCAFNQATREECKK